MPGQQLNLFRSRKQPGIAPPTPSEFQLHCAVVDTGPALAHTGLDFYPHCQRREARPGDRGQAEANGVTAGFPDLVFFGPHGEVCFIELKAGRGRLSESQQAIKRHLEAAGHGDLCSDDYRDVVEC